MSKLSEGKEIRLMIETSLWNKVRGLAHSDDRSIAEWVRKLLRETVIAHEYRAAYKLSTIPIQEVKSEPDTNPTTKEDSPL